MSWDSYIDNLQAQTKDPSGATHCDRAAIIGLDGSKWTTEGHPCSVKITQAEAQAIASAFKSGDFSAFMSGGVHLEGVKYQFLRAEPEGKVVYAKKKDHGAVTLQATKTGIVIGHCEEGKQQGNVNKGVGIIAEYLEGMNM